MSVDELLHVRMGTAGTRVLAAGTDAEAVQQELAGRGLEVRDVCLSRLEHDALLETLGLQLALPPHYGENWDALADCLADQDVVGQGWVLLVRGHEALEPSLRETLEEVLQEAVATWSEEGRTFWVLWLPVAL